LFGEIFVFKLGREQPPGAFHCKREGGRKRGKEGGEGLSVGLMFVFKLRREQASSAFHCKKEGGREGGREGGEGVSVEIRTKLSQIHTQREKIVLSNKRMNGERKRTRGKKRRRKGGREGGREGGKRRPHTYLYH
jgi:hypothetical protein